MESFDGKIAVITGAGTGMGRELAHSLATAGANLALCDVNEDNLTATAASCKATNSSISVTTHSCDVSDEAQVMAFRDQVVTQHHAEHVNLLFNNAGIAGGGSFVADERASWEKTFNVCWNGVYLCSRAFLPLLIAADEAHIINTSSINGLWASLGASRSHTAYSAAKFAVRGFTEALITDLRLNAPHVKASVVLPGHVGTEIVANSAKVHSAISPGTFPAEADNEITEVANAFRNHAPTTASQAAEIILDGVRAGEWRILVGEDAEILDGLLRDDPTGAYEQPFVDKLHALGALRELVT